MKDLMIMEKKIQMTVDKEQLTSRKRKVKIINGTLKAVTTLRITIIRLIIKNNNLRRMSLVKKVMTLKMERTKCQRVMIGMKRKRERITRTKRDIKKKKLQVKMREAIRTIKWMI